MVFIYFFTDDASGSEFASPGNATELLGSHGMGNFVEGICLAIWDLDVHCLPLLA